MNTLYSQHIDHAKIAPYAKHLAALKDTLQALKSSDQPLLAAAQRTDDLAEISALAKDIAGRFSHVVVVGAGGSSLSGKALCTLKPVSKPSLHFLETIDPDAIEDTLSRAPEACFIVISKSGKTVETLAHFALLTERVKHPREQMIAITEPGDNPLRSAAEKLGIRTLSHASDIGGRFAWLTNVGLLPMAIAGLDIAAFKQGTSRVVETMRACASPETCQPAIGAALQYAHAREGKNISVFFPYGERLAGLSGWYRQSWAESLGKNAHATTPLIAMGTTDQHSQLQLYLGGPKDKFFTLITARREGCGQRIDSYLAGKTTGDIMAAEQQATFETLARHHCPVRRITLESIDETSLGALFMHFTLEILFMAALMRVNPFDQPAVEESKRLALQYLQAGAP